MIEIIDKSKCCGCEACANICPKHCITMVEDEEGFRYPVVDKEKCVNCKLCEKVCPLKEKANNANILEHTQFYAAFNNEDTVLKDSSSGGVFSLLADYIFSKKGIVYGVVQKDTYNVTFIRTEKSEDLKQIRGSKYLQARVNDMYNKVKEDLEKGQFVLFSGTPCQIAALYNVLGKDYERLYTVDVVCHGVPSNAVYREYINYVEKKSNKKVTFIKWRDKIQGWGPNRVTLFFEDGTKHTTISRENPFQTGFLDNIYLRPSCYKCAYAKLPRIGDISLADFWGYDGKLLKNNLNKGLSILIITSKKGKDIFENIRNRLTIEEETEEYVKARSRHVYIHPIDNPRREEFFKDFRRMDFKKLSIKYRMYNPIFIKILKKIKRKVFR